MFKNKVALVTGGSRGIGEAIVKQLSEEGAIVYYTYVNETEKIEKEIQCAAETNIYPIKSDVSDYNSVESTIKKIVEEKNSIDFVINNAGITRDRAFALMKVGNWEEVINTNLNGTFNVCKNVIMKMVKQKSGKIVNITSVSGMVGTPYQTNYSASKAGIIGFTKSIAREVAGNGITVNAVAPGLINTDILSAIPAKKVESYLGTIPLKRFGNPKEVSSLVCFLLSDKANYITGEVIKIDGGLSC